MENFAGNECSIEQSPARAWVSQTNAVITAYQLRPTISDHASPMVLGSYSCHDRSVMTLLESLFPPVVGATVSLVF